MMQQYDKMILAILQGDDYHDAVHSLNEHGFYATVLNSSGGFLKKRSVTLMIGVGERPPGRGAGHPEEARRAHGDAL